jgi:hypothetical protein
VHERRYDEVEVIGGALELSIGGRASIERRDSRASPSPRSRERLK